MATESRIKTRQLSLLVQIDRVRSVLHAADAAGMSQPAASKLLRELEDTLGVSLFERHARGVVPTAFGEIVVRYAHSVLADLKRAADEVAALREGHEVQVSLGTVMTPGTTLVPQALARLAQRHPRLRVDVEIDYSRPMVARLLEGKLDILVARVLDPRAAADLDFEPLAEEPHSLIAGAHHPLARRRRPFGIEDLVEQAWILPPAASIVRERLNAMFLQRGLSLPARIIETSSLPIITSLLRQTEMLVALPEEVVRPYCEAGMLKVLPIDLNVRMDVFGLITRRGHAQSPGVLAALAALRDAAAELYRGSVPG